MSETKRWHSWVIKRNRLDIIVGYIKDKCPEIDKYFYPLIKKEYQTKKGVKIKDRPLYEGYLFLRYDQHSVVYHKLRQFPFVTTYAGQISDAEVEVMQASQGKLLSELKASKYVKGDKVVLLDGPFKGFEARVIKADGETVQVAIGAKLLGAAGVELVYAEDQVERKTELQNTEVQDI